MRGSAPPDLWWTRKIEADFKASPVLKAHSLGGDSARAVRIPIALALIVIATFLPVELSFYIAGLRFTAARLALILLFPFACVWIVQKVLSGRYRFVASDLFVLMAGFWIIYAPANVIGAEQALNHAGPTALEFCMGYMATRTMLSKHGHALSFVNLLCLVTAFAALLALLDPLTNRYITHEIPANLTAYPGLGRPIDYSGLYRNGFLRAAGPLEHPILLAVVCSVALFIALSVPIRLRGFVIVASILGAIFAFSSAALQAVAMGCALLIYGRMLAGFPHRWLALICVGAAGILFLFLLSDSPASLIIRYFTFDPSTGYYRYMTWIQVIDAVAPSPWYGLGFGPFADELDINHSVDSLWLVATIQSGVPGSILIALSMLGAASLPTSGPRVNLTMAESKLGATLGIVIFLLLFLAFTVDFLGTTWILCGLVAGLRAHLGELGRLGLDRSRNSSKPLLSLASDRARPPATLWHGLLPVRRH
jgi:hypothetical protein